MYKNIKILKKLDNIENAFSSASIEEKIQSTRFIPLGINEIKLFSNFAPVLINNKEDGEFVLFCGLANTHNIFTHNITNHEPLFFQTYPFLMLKAKNEKDEDINVIGFDDNKKYVGKDKKTTMFLEDKQTNPELLSIISKIKFLQEQRNISKTLIKELVSRDLLIQQSFNVKVEEKVIPILKNYYIVDKKKLNLLDNDILALWAKNGYMTLIDLHMSSLQNFKNII